MTQVTIVGCGDIGSRLARRLLEQGRTVAGWVRSADSQLKLQASGIPALQVDLDNEGSALPEPHARQLYYFAPPPPSGTTDSRVARLTQHLLKSDGPERVVYLSTTGVYGDCQGDWVDETRPPAPTADRARRRLDAEQRWREWLDQSGGELVVLRVAGIYGPGKLPVHRLESGQPMVSKADAPITNHIHSLDLVRICEAAMLRGISGEIYNVSDGRPDNMTTYFYQVAAFLGLPRPPVIPLAEAERRLSPGMLSYLRESRRLSNRKMLDELGVVLRYPDLQTGLPACEVKSAG